MDDAAKAAAPNPERHDLGGRRSGSVGTPLLDDAHDLQRCRMRTDSEGLEAWRQLTERYEPKMRTRFAGQLMSILSFSLQGDTIERMTAWEREIATYERDSGKILDDDIKIGTVLLRSPESQKKVHAVGESTTASQIGSQDIIMVRSVESYFDVGSVSEVTIEPRGAGGKICSMGAPNVREGESVDVEIDSGAEVSCLPVNIGADTYPLHETRLSTCGRSPRCGWWRQIV